MAGVAPSMTRTRHAQLTVGGGSAKSVRKNTFIPSDCPTANKQTSRPRLARVRVRVRVKVRARARVRARAKDRARLGFGLSWGQG